jgi:hypothetical protein
MTTVEQRLKALKAVMEEWPAGSLVWHRANGKRCVIVEYNIDAAGAVMLTVSFAAAENWDKCLPCCLSGRPVSPGGEGDEWKEGAGV